MNKQFNNFKIIDYGNEIYKLAEKNYFLLIEVYLEMVIEKLLKL